MKAFVKCLVFGSLLIVSWSCTAAPVRKLAEKNPWAEVKIPSKGQRGSIGFYSAGCLDGALQIPSDGPGYQVMRLSRNRFYGTSELIDFITHFTRVTLDEKVGVLLIGDMSQPRGGPMPPNGHASHQVGLDVDIWYWVHPDAQYRPLTPTERENLSAISLVDLEKQVIKKDTWRPEHVQMLKIAATQSDVERIFVNPVIKKELCETVPAAQRGWLQRLRPWFGHDDHFHVRLKCPKGDSLCTAQSPVPAGDGCDQLAWWFTPEAREAGKTNQASERPLPALPGLCDGVLKDSGI